MSKKKSTSKKSTIQSAQVRYEKLAYAIVSSIPSIRTEDHILLSLIKRIPSPTGKQEVVRYDIGLRRDPDAIKQTPGKISRTEFTAELGKALHKSGKDGADSQLVVAFFTGTFTEDNQLSLTIPEGVYQWAIKDNGITPHVTPGNTWNGIAVERGPKFDGKSFSYDPEVDPDEFFDEDIKRAGTTAGVFLRGIFDNAPAGTHRLTSELTEYDKTAVVFFQKDSEGLISSQDNIEEVLSFMASTVLQGGNVSSMLHSFLSDESNDGQIITDPNVQQEIRGWSVSIDEVYALSQKQLTDAYLRDFKTGTMENVPANISYVSAWEISI